MDIVRVLRVIEYVGERKRVEETVARSITEHRVDKGLTIRGATIGAYPEILTTTEAIENVLPDSTVEGTNG